MHLSPIVSILITVYWTILVVVLVGDKAIYTIASLASQYSLYWVYLGTSIAFMAKALAAVLFAQLLLRVPPRISAGISAAILFATAAALWRKASGPRSSDKTGDKSPSIGSGFAIAFAAIFFSEWGDVGQLSTAALSARYQMPFVVWIAASAALMTKGILALTLGVQLRRLLPDRILRIAAVGSCCVLGLVTMWTAVVR